MKILARVLVSAGVLTALLLLLPWNEIRSAVTRMPLLTWSAVLGGFLVGHSLGVVKWRMLLNTGRSNLALLEAVRCYAAGLFANLCLPSIVGGDVVRATLAARATGRSEAAVLGGIADRMIDLLALGSLLVAGGLAAGLALPAPGSRALSAILILAATSAGVLIVVAVRRPLRSWPQRIRRPIGRSLVALRRLGKARGTAIAAFSVSLLIQGGFVLLNAWIGRSIGISVPLSTWFLVWPLAKLAGLLPVSLGGLGVRDATLGGLLVLAGVPLATGVVASLIWQSILIASGLLAGVGSYVLTRHVHGRRALGGELSPDIVPRGRPRHV